MVVRCIAPLTPSGPGGKGRFTVIVRITPNDKGQSARKTRAPPNCTSLRVRWQISAWLASRSGERRGGGGRNVTFPARSYSVNGERRSYALLRPITDATSQNAVRDLVPEALPGIRRTRRHRIPGASFISSVAYMWVDVVRPVVWISGLFRCRRRFSGGCGAGPQRCALRTAPQAIGSRRAFSCARWWRVPLRVSTSRTRAEERLFHAAIGDDVPGSMGSFERSRKMKASASMPVSSTAARSSGRCARRPR